MVINRLIRQILCCTNIQEISIRGCCSGLQNQSDSVTHPVAILCKWKTDKLKADVWSVMGMCVVHSLYLHSIFLRLKNQSRLINILALTRLFFILSPSNTRAKKNPAKGKAHVGKRGVDGVDSQLKRKENACEHTTVNRSVKLIESTVAPKQPMRLDILGGHIRRLKKCFKHLSVSLIN